MRCFVSCRRWLAAPLMVGAIGLGLMISSPAAAQGTGSKKPARPATKSAGKSQQKSKAKAAGKDAKAKEVIGETEQGVKRLGKVAKVTAETVQAVAPDLSMVPPSAHVGVVFQPQILVQSPHFAMAPYEIITAAGMQQWGLDPTRLKQITLLVNVQNPPMPSYAVVLRSLDPLDTEVLAGNLGREWQDAEEGGTQYKLSNNGIGYQQPAADTLVIGTGPVFLEVVGGKKAEDQSALLKRLQAAEPGHIVSAVVDLEPVRQQLAMVQQMARQVPPQFQEFTRIPDLLTAVELHAGVAEMTGFQLILDAKDEAAGKELNELIDKGISQLFEQLQQQMAVAPMGEQDAMQVAANAYTTRILQQAIDSIDRQHKGKRITLTIEGDGAAGIAGTGVGVALLLPAVQAAREAARRSMSLNNLKQIALAIHNYHDVYNRFPSDIKDEEGKPLLSWRVSLLPFLEQKELYDQFKLDEPWDSEHNRPLLDQMPATLQSPNSEPGNKTIYLGVAGPGTLFEGKQEKLTFADITDGTSNTIGVVEADLDRAVEWTRPADLVVDFTEPMAGLGNLRPGVFNAMMLDGSVRSVSNAINPEMLKKLFTIAGSEVVEQF